MIENEKLIVSNMFAENLILVDVVADNKIELLEKLSDYVIKLGYVKATFKKAIIEREKGFPTGLAMERINIAIPHSDAVHVIKPSVLVAKLKKPVEFKAMGLDDVSIPVTYIFLLMANKDNHQVYLLQNMMNLCNSDETINSLRLCDTKRGILKIILDFYKNNFEY